MLSFTFKYGSFWRRVTAGMIDMVIIALLSIVLFVPTAAALGIRAMSETMHRVPFSVFILRTYGISAIIVVLVAWLYSALFESSRWQATIGKQAMGLIVFTANEGRMTFRRASMRFWMKLVSLCPICLGYAFIFRDAKKRALHDILTGSIVLENGLEERS